MYNYNNCLLGLAWHILELIADVDLKTSRALEKVGAFNTTGDKLIQFTGQKNNVALCKGHANTIN